MAELSGQPAELRFTLHIKRAATGLTDTVDMVGVVQPTPQSEPDQPLAITDPIEGAIP